MLSCETKKNMNMNVMNLEIMNIGVAIFHGSDISIEMSFIKCSPASEIYDTISFRLADIPRMYCSTHVM